MNTYDRTDVAVLSCALLLAAGLVTWAAILNNTRDAKSMGQEPAPVVHVVEQTTTSTTTTSTIMPTTSMKMAPTTVIHATTTTTTGVPAKPVVSQGSNHSCAVVKGSVWCWGHNERGQLGGFTANTTAASVKVEGLPARVDEVQAGDANTCALADKRVWCWGWRTAGTSQNPDDALYPLEVPLRNVTHLAVGLGQMCAATSEGGVARIYCWGDGWSHVGTGGYDGAHYTNTPVLVGEYAHVHDLEAGYRTARAHVGFLTGGCAWLNWGQGYGYGQTVIQ